MGNFLQAVGQARLRPEQAIMDYDRHKQRTAINKSALEGMEINQNLKREQLKQIEEYNTPMDAEVIRQSMSQSGPMGKVMADYSYNWAVTNGRISKDGTIKKGHAQEIGKILSEPFHLKRIHEANLSAAQENYKATLQEMNSLAEKGTDNKQYQEAVARNKQAGDYVHKARVGMLGAEKAAESFSEWGTPESIEEYWKTGDSSVVKKRVDEPEEKDTRTTNEKDYDRSKEDPGYLEFLDRNEKDEAEATETRTASMKDYDLAKKDPEYAKFLKNKSGQVDKRKFADETKMRKEFQSLPEVKNHVLIDSQVQRLDRAMEEAKTTNSLVAVDQALITILNKMLDPSSVVRESEYARTPGDLAFINRMRGKIEKLVTGGAGLTGNDRKAIARMARSFYAVSKGMYDSQVKYYNWLSEGYGYDAANVVRLGEKETEVLPNSGTSDAASGVSAAAQALIDKYAK